MKTFISFFLASTLLFLLIGCKKDKPEPKPPVIVQPAFQPWTQAETDLIMAGDSSEPMRILLVSNSEDSLFLRKKSIPINPNPNDPILIRLRQRMLVTMTQAGGVGIAAPQVGIGRDLFWCKRFDLDNDPFQFIINPKVNFYSVKMVTFPWDGCLSMPGYSGATQRHSSIFVEYYTQNGVKELNILEGFSSSNFTSICFQHEYDHLRGILFTDRIGAK